MKSIRCLFFFVFAVTALATAQQRCANTPDYFQPQAAGDGQRYPLAIGPLTWNLVGSGIYPVAGSDGMVHVAFTMQFTNNWNQPATVASLEVVDPAHNNQPTGANRVLSIKEEDVTGQMKRPSLPAALDKTSYSAQLPGGAWGIMFFDVTYPSTADVPCSIALRAHVLQPDNPHLPESTVISPPMKLSTQSAVRLSPPFKGDGWLNANGCCLEIGPHRFVMNPMNGRLDPSEQFAIDWIKVDEHGKAFRTDGKKSEDWLCYGADILAVGPGTVVEVMRDLPDEPPGVAPTSLTVPEIAGNHVLLDLGDGRYAMYAHLAPHSVTVHVGDHVKAGDKLGLLGNSGNTTGPHLHFQISDRPSTLDVTSLPFVFEHMTVQNRSTMNMEDMENESIAGKPITMDGKPPKQLRDAMPLTRDVIDFGK